MICWDTLSENYKMAVCLIPLNHYLATHIPSQAILQANHKVQAQSSLSGEKKQGFFSVKLKIALSEATVQLIGIPIVVKWIIIRIKLGESVVLSSLHKRKRGLDYFLGNWF